MRLHEVLRHTLALAVHLAEVELCDGIPGFSHSGGDGEAIAIRDKG